MIKLTRAFVLPAMAALLVLVGLTGCSDPPPAEVSMNVTYQGQTRSCTVLVFNAKGNQVQQEHADQYGVVYVKGLPPGQYTFKFQGHDGQMYPAVRGAKVGPEDSYFMKVELTQAEDAEHPVPAA